MTPPRPFKVQYPTFCTRCGKEVVEKGCHILVRDENINKDNGVRIKRFIDLCPKCYTLFETWLKK